MHAPTLEATVRLTPRQLRLLEDARAREAPDEPLAAFVARAYRATAQPDPPDDLRDPAAPVAAPADAIGPGAAAALVLAPGEVVRVEQPRGGQCADLVAWSATDTRERLSAARTRALEGCAPGRGARLVSGPPFERPLLALIADSAPGHDLLFPACSPLEYARAGCLPEPSCATVQAAAAARFGIDASDVPDPLNLWLRSGVAPAGDLTWSRPATRAGDHVELIALAPVLVVVNPCVDDVFGCSGLEPGALVVRTRTASPGELAAWPATPPAAVGGRPRPLARSGGVCPPARARWHELVVDVDGRPAAIRAAAVRYALGIVGPA